MSNITGLFHLLGILNKLGRLAELLYSGVSIYSGLFRQFLIKKNYLTCNNSVFFVPHRIQVRLIWTMLGMY